MKSLLRSIRNFIFDESGQGMLEYLLIIGLIVLVLIVALYAFRDAIKSFITKVINYINSASGKVPTS